ncbi:MAG: adenylyltransferase [Omnitrophica bacterium RIFCSPLOWO2_12_FULL_44_17]|uniref:Molybdopterin-synthase adenylyltransferase n=1 Tax=Candidatus Danuiimicrobium aquiferis TaxID=1801832 RepID=A0A1G1KQS5_9BACT|nr:MAG: adenylyltransferase [Omnitrophica bacterium RIFCSPHIGHO2_02_FULL_45_28]OGW95271.1 MAG: adenylyltransferase [Omnitrophica bacterium RIFCSPLOWO2_12_FULL_44_17]OGX01731.1 MAG: adenylyltransferase [Omnitrophica bacterium RIFCSPLOWO2_02_FULL_44_11]
MNFNEEQIERYSRHIILKDVGVEGQEKMMAGKVLIIGTGGLGAPAALYLAAAGVGVIGLVDADNVELSNLQRQVIHFTPDVNKPKVISAKEKIEAINPDVKVVTYHTKVFSENITGIIKDYDFVIDGTDNFAAKFLINDACVFAAKPFSHGAILRFSGQTITYVPGSTCYRCIFLTPPPTDAVPNCSQAGILGAVAGMLGTIQATEALKFLIKKGELLQNRLLTFDALDMKFREVAVTRNPRCPICGENPSIKKLIDEAQPVCSLKNKNKKT